MAVKKLLLAFVTTSLLSALANVVGKQNVAASEWLVGVLIVFGLLMHALSYIGYSRNFTIEQYNLDTEEEDGTSIDDRLIATGTIKPVIITTQQVKGATVIKADAYKSWEERREALRKALQK